MTPAFLSPFFPLYKLLSLSIFSRRKAWEQAIRTPEDEALASHLSLRRKFLADDRAPATEAAQLRPLWWAALLKHDPVRLLRAWRFAVTLGFCLDASLWRTRPFALQPGYRL